MRRKGTKRRAQYKRNAKVFPLIVGQKYFRRKTGYELRMKEQFYLVLLPSMLNHLEPLTM